MEHELADRFAFHPASTVERQRAHEDVRSMLGTIAFELNSMLPEGREKALVMTKLEEATFWANAAIARKAGG
jgi:hypothetical protein